MPHRIRLNVTDKHIARGRTLPTQSPIALALRDATANGGGGAAHAVVHKEQAFILKARIYWRASLPVEAVDFDNRFHAGRLVQPVEFVLKFQRMDSGDGASRPPNNEERT